MTTEIGKLYRDKIKNVVGTAIAHAPDDDGKTMTRLDLDPVHIESHPDVLPGSTDHIEKAHNYRWYDDDRLEEVAADDVQKPLPWTGPIPAGAENLPPHLYAKMVGDANT